MIGGVAAVAAVRTFPFRVFSFPSEIRVATIDEILIEQQQNVSVYDFFSLPSATFNQTLFNLSRITNHDSQITLRDAQGKR